MELKPCPWCGSTDVTANNEDVDGILCNSCGFYWSFDGAGDYDTIRAETIERWNNRPIEDELRQRAAQWQQLCDSLGLAHATHPHYIADELKAMRDSLTYIAQRNSTMTGTPLGSQMDERRIWQDMGKRAAKAVNW
jgi:hypothetical protein